MQSLRTLIVWVFSKFKSPDIDPHADGFDRIAEERLNAKH